MQNCYTTYLFRIRFNCFFFLFFNQKACQKVFFFQKMSIKSLSLQLKMYLTSRKYIVFICHELIMQCLLNVKYGKKIASLSKLAILQKSYTLELLYHVFWKVKISIFCYRLIKFMY